MKFQRNVYKWTIYIVNTLYIITQMHHAVFSKFHAINDAKMDVFPNRVMFSLLLLSIMMIMPLM